MKKIVEDVSNEGLEKFLGEKIILLCANYFYAGKLVGVNESCVLLEEASIVYETGKWDANSYQDSQRLPGPWYVQTTMIESFGLGR